jgi:hypothetical protein
MSLQRRLANLEKLHGDDGPVHIIVVTYSGASEAEIEAAKEEAMRRRPGEKFYYVVVPPPGRGEKAP